MGREGLRGLGMVGKPSQKGRVELGGPPGGPGRVERLSWWVGGFGRPSWRTGREREAHPGGQGG